MRPVISPNDIVAMLAEVGAWGVNLHDNDLVPIDATPAERDGIVRVIQEGLREKWPCRAHGHRVACSFIPFFATALSPQTIPRFALTRFKKPCEPWTLALNWARRFLSCGADAKVLKPTLAVAADEAVKRLARSRQLSLPIQYRSRIRYEVRARSEAQRAAGRYLHVHDRPVIWVSFRRSIIRKWWA